MLGGRIYDEPLRMARPGHWTLSGKPCEGTTLTEAVDILRRPDRTTLPVALGNAVVVAPMTIPIAKQAHQRLGRLAMDIFGNVDRGDQVYIA